MPKIERSIITIKALVAIDIKNEAEAKRKFSLLAYTGKPIDTWFGSVVMDISGMETKAKVPILRNHDHGKIVGWADAVEKSADGLSVSGVFSDATDSGKEVLALADEGFPWQASIGIKPLRIKQLASDQETESVNGTTVTGPIEIWTQSLVGEVSVVPWGTDNDTGMTLLSESGKVSVYMEESQNKGDETMNLQELKEKLPDLYREVFELGAASIDIEKIRYGAEISERERVVAILSEGADPTATDRAIKEGTSLVESFKLFYQAEKAKKATELSSMAASANNSLGHQAPADPQKPITNPSEEVSKRAIEMSLKEKVSLSEATQRVLSQDRALADQYRQQFNA